MSFLKLPVTLTNTLTAHKKWLSILDEAKTTVEEDAELQRLVVKGLRLKERALPPEVLGRNYARYCGLVNKMYDAYLNSVHIQRAPYIEAIITIVVKRMYELRNELVHLIVNDYIYVDSALAQLRMTPQDIQIVVPYHFPLESRSDNIELVLQKMWADAVKRKRIRERPPKPKPPKPAPPQPPPPRRSLLYLAPLEEMEHVETIAPKVEQQQEEEAEEEEEEEIESLPPSVHTLTPEEFIQSVLIQRHERFRQWFMKDLREKTVQRKMFYGANVEEAPEELKNKAARVIQMLYREYMKIKRERVRDVRRDILLGLIPDPFRSGPSYTEENNKVYERRRNTRMKIKQSYLKELEKENTRLLAFRKGDQLDDITDEIRTWFKEWYYGYGFFPEYPYEVEGGTLLVVRGEFPTIEEKQEEDERIAILTKGKTKDQLKEEKAQAKADALLKAEALKENQRKEALALQKARCNPFTDPGYMPQVSGVVQELIEALHNYRTSWSIYDDMQPDKFGETIYGYLKPLLTEELMIVIHKDCRKFVDELMRLDLKVLIQMQQLMYKRFGWKYPKIKPRKKPKLPSVRKPLEIDHNLLKNFERVFDLNIVTKPTTKISDVYGDSNYAAYELNIKDPNATYPLPGYGDIKRRLLFSCVMGCGIQPGAPKRRSVMLVGPERNGKSFLADAVAGELNAVKFDITPEVFSAVLGKPARVLTQVFVAARAFQPSVIFFKNIERVFTIKVPPQDKYLKAKGLKTILTKLVKQISDEDKVIFIATCTNPLVARTGPMVKMFDEILLVPRTDYGSLQQFFYEKLLSVKSIPRDCPVQPLAQLLQGYGFGDIIEAYDDVMTPERIVRLNVEPFSPGEILEALLYKGLEPMTLEEYQNYVDFFLNHSPLKTEREDYEKINFVRDEMYKKMEKKKREAEKAKAQSS